MYRAYFIKVFNHVVFMGVLNLAAIGHNARPIFQGLRHPFSSTPKIDKIVENLQKQNGKERTKVVCSRDVKQMNIGSLADENGKKRMTTPKWLLDTISKQMHS